MMRLREINPAACPFPVGSILQMTGGADPSSIWPGTTWSAMSGVFLYGTDATHALGTTGGSENVTLTVDQMPSHDHAMGAHTHAFTQPTVPAHNHGLNSHTHTYAKPNTPTGGTAISEAQLAAHHHQQYVTTNSGNTAVRADHNYDGNCGRYPQCQTGDAGSGSAHTHTIGTTSTNSGGPSTANTADKAAFTYTGGAVGAMNNSPATGSRGGFSAFEHAAVQGGQHLGAHGLGRRLRHAS